MDAHRLVLLAEREGQGPRMAEALFRAYFSEGKALTDPWILVEIAVGVGLNGDAVGGLLASRNPEAQVEASQELAYSFGVQGVPFYVFERRFGLSGAQPLEVFLRVLDRVQAGPGDRAFDL